jgi:tRNA threonylcarbamoyladenosine modification (KEOPS) complex Cgi121 subunit
LLFGTEAGEFVWIAAFETKPDKIEQVLDPMHARYPEVTVQLVDLDKVAGSRYLFLATYNALRSHSSKEPIARSLGIEILLYIAGDRQIGAALERVGITPETKRTAGIVVGRRKERVLESGAALRELLKKSESDVLLDKWNQERTRRVRSVFGIGEKEIAALRRGNEDVSKVVERLAIERSAMLAIKK